jgi:NAD-dependent SIR2 family protein deacetylase
MNEEVLTLCDFIHAHPRLVILTGAGISAEAGIPTYRDESGTWLHQTPIQEQDFLRDAETRRRYWARSWYGWPVIRDAQPAPTHTALARLEKTGRIALLITQNVDGLHQRAGSRNVIDLHGRVDRVRCLTCIQVHSRDSVQTLLAANNQWPDRPSMPARPDGDSDIPPAIVAASQLPTCLHCGGQLMPDVVFFGGSVPASTVTTCMDALQDADALLVVGSSLAVFSGYRFCRNARQWDKPLAIINPGVTRADDLAQVRLHSPAGPLLTAVATQF